MIDLRNSETMLRGSYYGRMVPEKRGYARKDRNQSGCRRMSAEGKRAFTLGPGKDLVGWGINSSSFG